MHRYFTAQIIKSGNLECTVHTGRSREIFRWAVRSSTEFWGSHRIKHTLMGCDDWYAVW